MDSGDRGPAVLPAGRTALSRSRTVERELVHRVSVAEVLLTDVARTGADTFEAAACWPRSHPTFPRGRDDRHSPLMAVETIRQLGIYLPLRFYGLDPAARMLISDVSFALDPAAEPRAEFGATDVTCEVSVYGVRAGAGGVPRAMRTRVRFLVDGVPFARAEGGARFVRAGAYAVLRAGAGAGVWSPGARRPDHRGLGVTAPGDVLVARDGRRLVLDPADPRHPFLFDHGSDHVPGVALIEAARQAAAAATAGRLLRPVGGRLEALRFTEHTPRARVECAVYARTAVFRFRQGGSHTAIGVLRYV